MVTRGAALLGAVGLSVGRHALPDAVPNPQSLAFGVGEVLQCLTELIATLRVEEELNRSAAFSRRTVGQGMDLL